MRRLEIVVLAPSRIYFKRIHAPPSREFAGPIPKASFISCPNRGNTKPRKERNTAVAAETLAAYWNESTRYSCIGTLKESVRNMLKGQDKISTY